MVTIYPKNSALEWVGVRIRARVTELRPDWKLSDSAGAGWQSAMAIA
jgi:hypothetical protein